MDKETWPEPGEAAWCFEERGFRPGLVPHYESIFALANGYMGVRASPETNPGLGDPGFYAAGVYDRVRGHVHEIVNLPCWLGLELHVDGFPFDLLKGEVLAYRRALDLRQGLLFTNVLWRDAARHTTRLETVRLVHRTRPHDALILGRVTAEDYTADLQLGGGLDAWRTKYGSPSGRARLDRVEAGAAPDGGMLLAASTRETGLRVALAASLEVDGGGEPLSTIDEDRVRVRRTVRAERGRPVMFCKRVCAWTSRDDDDPEARATEGLAAWGGVPAPEAVASHAAAWRAAWDDIDVRIEGDPRAQRAVRFNVFHLASLANPGDPGVSLGAKGLHGNGYNGQVFWDTEIFLLPFYTWTQPDAARALLAYRRRFLDDARANAAELGRAGAFYPWNSSCTGRFPQWKSWQEHVGSDIVYGLDAYARATGDEAFLREQGAEIVLETARYWAKRAERDEAKHRYVIRHLTGPDEIHRGVDNNAYTNLLVRWHLRYAAALAEALPAADRARLGAAADEPARWREIAGDLYEGFRANLGFHEQFEGYLGLEERELDRSLTRMAYTGPVQRSFRPTKIAQQADTVLLYWMFRDAFPAELMRKAYAYYEPRCSHTSSLSRCIYAALAARLGMEEEALHQFLDSAEVDLAEGKEMESESGIHAASMGGTWVAAVQGFGGVEAGDDALRVEPRLPPAWEALSFRVRWHGTPVDVEVRGRTLRLRADGGEVPVRCGALRATAGADPVELDLDAAGEAPRPVRGVVFDLDGVLVHTDNLHYRAWKELADAEGIPFDETVNHRLRGVSRMESLAILLEAADRTYTNDERGEMAERKNARYRELLDTLSPADVTPGARACLDGLRGRGVRLAVASSSRNARRIMERTGLLDAFDAIVDGTDLSASKPDPEAFLLAASRLGLAAVDCVGVEDAPAGVVSARGAGMRVLAVGPASVHPGAGWRVERFEDVTADALLRSSAPGA